MTAVLLALALLPLATANPERYMECGLNTNCRLKHEGANGDQVFKIKGEELVIKVTSDTFTFKCKNNIDLDTSELPYFVSPGRKFNEVLLRSCPPPTRGYAAALQAMGLLLPPNLILEDTPHKLTLTKEALAGLQGNDSVKSLKLTSKNLLTPAEGALPSLRGLTTLGLKSVALPPADVAALPRTLTSLSIEEQGASSIDGNVLLALPELRQLTLKSAYVSQPQPADLVHIGARAGRLRNLTLSLWLQPHMPRWTDCAHLQTLSVSGVDTDALPALWLDACPQLHDLRLSGVLNKNTALQLPADLLKGTALSSLSITRGKLERLPRGLLSHSPNLTLLDLSFNCLTTLPSDLFYGIRELRQLWLYSNRLGAGALSALPASLTVLRLNNNPLGPLCDNALRNSPLEEMKELKQLELVGTDQRHSCQDWRDSLLQLASLDLSNNKIRYLEKSELLWSRQSKGSGVQLGDNPLSQIVVLPEEAADLTRKMAGPLATLYFPSGTLDCNCSMFYALTLVRAWALPLEDATCSPTSAASGKNLIAVENQELQCGCDVAGWSLADCICSMHLRSDQVRVVNSKCSPGVVPQLPAGLAHSRDLLRLRLTGLSELRTDQIPSRFELLDLSGNNLTGLDEAASDALSRAGGEVRLAGNPFSCECARLGFARALRRRPARVDLENATCRDRGGADHPLLETLDACRDTSGVLAAVLYCVLAVLLAATLGLAALLAKPLKRRRLKGVLRELGLLPVAAEGGPASFDVFVSFAHADVAAAERLAALLEPRRRLCLHHRDWLPGETIPAQITTSVLRSRRTVALLSPEYVSSEWARAEFREARALSPRLVAVLLVPAERLPRNTELDAFLALNTYLRYDDERFEDKLERALAEPCAPAAAPTSPGPQSPIPRDLKMQTPKLDERRRPPLEKYEKRLTTLRPEWKVEAESVAHVP